MTAITNWIQYAAWDVPSGHKVVIGKLHHSNNYAAGGDTITPQTIGLNSIVACLLANNQNARLASWSNANNGMMLYTCQNSTTSNALLAEMNATTNGMTMQTVASFIGITNIG